MKNATKKIINPGRASIIMILISAAAAFGAGKSDSLSAGAENRGRASGDTGIEIEDRVPEIKTGAPYFLVLPLDLVVPGGGHFYQGNYYQGAAFAGLKLAGAYALYYFYTDLENRKDDYHALRDDPSAEDREIENSRRNYERAHQHVLFSVIGNAALYAASLVLTFSGLSRTGEKSIPTFGLLYSSGPGRPLTDHEIILLFNLRI